MGLIGPSRFAEEFAQELVAMERAGPVVAVPRDLGKAQAFASQFGFEKACGSYEELFAERNVDIVYIVVPHVFHAEISKEAILKQGAEVIETFEDSGGGMVAAEIEAVMDALGEGLTECPEHTHADSIRLTELMHEVRRQVGSLAT